MTGTTERRSQPDDPDHSLNRLERIRHAPDAADRLIGLLREQGPLYAGRGTTGAERLRGYLLASFESIGLPRAAEPYMLEELESGLDPHAVAGAARALRGAACVPAGAPELLVAAMVRLRGGDDYVSFDSAEPTKSDSTAITALAEMARTLAILGPRARSALSPLTELASQNRERFAPSVQVEIDRALAAMRRPALTILATSTTATTESMRDASRPLSTAPVRSLNRVADLMMQDQDGHTQTLAAALRGRPSVLGFFYTRCENPLKCSLTIGRLADVANRLAADGDDTTVAAITYDPAFDQPTRMRKYGADRGMHFDERCRLLRTIGPFDPLRRALDLGVGFGPVTVNRHRIDLLVLKADLTEYWSSERRLWDPTDVVRKVKHLSAAS